MATLDDILELYSGSPDAAKNQAASLAQAIRGRRALGQAGLITGDTAGMGALGKELTGDADRLETSLMGAAQHRAQIQPQLELAEARRHPAYLQVLRQQGHQYGLDIPQDAPPLVLEKALDRAQHGQQALWGMQARAALHGFQMKKDSDGEMVRHDPITGAVYHEDGSMKRPPIRALPGFAGGGVGAPPAGPAGAPPPAAGPQPGGPRPAPAPAGAPPPAAAPAGPAGQRLFGQELRKAQQALGKDFDTNTGTGEIAANQKRLNAALRLKALVTDENGKVKDFIPPQFMTETAMALAQLVNSGGQPAQSLVEHITPKTKSGSLAEITQWITDHPQDAGQQEFVKLYLESAEREAKVAEEAMRNAVAARAGKHSAFIRGNPAEAKATLEPYGFTVDQEGNVVPKAKGGGHAAPAAPAPVRAKDKQGNVVEWNGTAWVPVKG